MTAMKKLVFLLMVLLPMSAGAQAPAVNSDDSYEFILAKLAAEDGRYDEALAKVDKLVNKNPDNVVLQYERAMILVDASRIDDAEAALRKVVAAKADFYDAQRMLGRIIIDRAGSDRAKIDDALSHLQAAFKIYPGAPHGFHADYRPSYRKEAAEQGWNEMIAWFKKYGVLS